MKKNAIYPGTFDPLTNGHIDIIKRSLKIFDEITVLLATNTQKETFFTLEERTKQIDQVIKKLELQNRVKIDNFEGLLVDYCKKNNINILIRGLRPLIDFEYEFEMAMNNRSLNSSIETIFIITDQKYFYLRSSLIKDIVFLGGDVSDKVPPFISENIKRKLNKF